MASLALTIGAAATFITALGGFIVILRQRPAKPNGEASTRVGVLIDLLAEREHALEACLARERAREHS